MRTAVGAALSGVGARWWRLTRASAATERVGHGEALEAVAALSLLADDVEDSIDHCEQFDGASSNMHDRTDESGTPLASRGRVIN